MISSIMQPTFLPWLGYFQLINSVDKFVFLDDVQYSKGSWHNRNQILLSGKKQWITIPIKKKKLNSLLCQTLVKEKDLLKNKFRFQIIEAYKNHDHFNCLLEILDFSKNINSNVLSEINISLIKFISSKLNLNHVEFLKSSQINSKGKRTKKVISILENISASKYISTIGAKEYLTQDGFISQTKIPLVFFKYSQKEYIQKMSLKFISNLSIIDILANIGWLKTEHYVKSNSINEI